MIYLNSYLKTNQRILPLVVFKRNAIKINKEVGIYTHTHRHTYALFTHIGPTKQGPKTQQQNPWAPMASPGSLSGVCSLSTGHMWLFKLTLIVSSSSETQAMVPAPSNHPGLQVSGLVWIQSSAHCSKPCCIGASVGPKNTARCLCVCLA